MNKKMNTDDIKLKGKVFYKTYARLEKWHQRVMLSFLKLFKNDWHIIYLDKYSFLRDPGTVNNLIMSVGKAAIAGLVGNTGAISAFTFLGLGSSNTAPAIGQTTLGAEISTNGLARAAATVTRTTTNVANDTLTLSKSFSVSGTQGVEEAGIFNASSVGIMLGRALTGTKSLVNGDTYVVTYNVIFT